MDACRARLERVPLLLKRFRQAVLAAATSGRLTDDLAATRERWAPAIPSRKLVLMASLADVITYGCL